MPQSLRKKTIHALSWSLLESVGLQGMRFVIGILLARLLFPEQFGLIGMLAIFIAVAQSLTDSGFGVALIQQREVTRTDTCSIFYFNLAIGLAVTGLLCFSAPWIADFYREPLLIPLTRAMSLVIVIQSFAVVHINLLQKQLAFKTLTKANLIANVLSGLVGVAMAIAGFGVWSLVGQQIAVAIFQTFALWFLNTWRPAWLFSLGSLRQMFSFGSRMLASGLLDQIFSNLYYIVIGRLFSAADLGYFTRAKTIQELPSNTLSGLVTRVTFPVFATIQDDPARLKKALKKALTILALVNFPMMIGLALTARPLVILLLTDKWADCIPYLQLLCFYGLLYPMHAINLIVLQALGHSKLFLRLEILKKVLIVVSIAVTWRWGISAMIWGLLSLSIVAYYINSYYTGKFIGYPMQEQGRDMLPYLGIAGLMGVAVHAVGLLPFPGHGSMLLGEIAAGGVIYVFLCRLFRLTAFMELWEAGFSKIGYMRTETPG